jgi:hypothetical protein
MALCPAAPAPPPPARPALNAAQIPTVAWTSQTIG